MIDPMLPYKNQGYDDGFENENEYSDESAEVENERPGGYKIAIIFGIVFIVLGILDSILLYAIPLAITKSNMKKYPDATFEKVDPRIVLLHFALHISLVLLGLTLLFWALYLKCSQNCKNIVLLLVCVLTTVMYVLLAYRVYKSSKTVVSTITKLDTINLTSQAHPVDFYYILLHDTKKVETCKKNRKCTTKSYICYSASPAKIPTISTLASPPFDYTDTPDMYFLVIKQNPVMIGRMATIYNDLMSTIQGCPDGKYHIDVEKYPIIEGTYLISTTRSTPLMLKSSSRMVSILLGFGGFYEVYSKSLPYITHTQSFLSDVVPDVDYSGINTGCSGIGNCILHNSKPTP